MGLLEFARAISSARDPALAAWQEAGLSRRGSQARTPVVIVTVIALLVGIGVGALALHYVLWPALGLRPELDSIHRTSRRAAATVIAAAGLLTALAGLAAAFISFQGLSGTIFRALGRPVSGDKKSPTPDQASG